MAKVYSSAIELIGSTPLVELKKIEKKFNLKSRLFAKLESYNVFGSVKDRAALKMIEAAEKDGTLRLGTTIVEPTSGNTGIGLAAVGRAKGYRTIIVMPSSMSVERTRLAKAYGGEVVFSDGDKGMNGAIEKAKEIAEKENGVILGQFENPHNIEAHYASTGPEIFSALDGKVDAFVSAVGTGGTISGVGKFLKEKTNGAKIIAVEPTLSPTISQGKSGKHGIQGIGAGFIPKTLDLSVIDEVLTVLDEDAFSFAKIVAEEEGYLVGISSGAALKAAVEFASRERAHKQNVVVLFPDGGDRYYSTALFCEE